MGKNKKQAFTIVELLVVIVVIGILAAITIVSYSGIQNKAIGANLRTDLVSDSKQLKMYNVEYGHYPSSIDTNYCPATPEPDTRYCLKSMNGAKLSYVGGGQAFTLFDKHTATGITYKISEGSEPAISVLPASFVNIYESSASTSNWTDSAAAVDITDDDGYVITGKYSSQGTQNLFVKFGSDNNILSAKSWSIPNANIMNSIKKTTDGGVVISGDAGSSTTRYPFLAKFSSTSQLSWTRLWSTSTAGSAKDVVQTSDGGYVVTGDTGADVFISKFSNDGNLSWTKTYNFAGNDYSNAIVQTSDGGYTVTGYTDQSGGPYGLILKTDLNGNISWSKTWRNNDVTIISENGQDIVQAADGGYVIVGRMTLSGKSESSILKFASDGSYQWHNYLSSGTNVSMNGLILASDGNYVISGVLIDSAKSTTTSDIAIAKFSSGGAKLWSQSYGEGSVSEGAAGLYQAADGGYMIVGQTTSGTKTRLLAMKYKSDGTINNCSSPTCKSDLVSLAGQTIRFPVTTPVATSQSYTTTNNTYTVNTAALTRISGINP